MSKQKLKYIIIALSAVFVLLLILFLYVLVKQPAEPVPLGPENMIDISDIDPSESTEPHVEIPIVNEEYIEIQTFSSPEEYEATIDSMFGNKKSKSNKQETVKTKEKSEEKEEKTEKKKKKNKKKKNSKETSDKKKKKKSK